MRGSTSGWNGGFEGVISSADDGDRDETIAINEARVCQFILGRRLEESHDHVKYEARHEHLLPQASEQRLGSAPIRFDDNYELCRFLALPFLDEARAEVERSVTAEKFSTAPKIGVTLWEKEVLHGLSTEELSSFQQVQEWHDELFPYPPQSLLGDHFVELALEIYGDLASAGPEMHEEAYHWPLNADSEARLLPFQVVILYEPGAIELVEERKVCTAGPELVLRIEKETGYCFGLLAVSRKASFPLIYMLRNQCLPWALHRDATNPSGHLIHHLALLDSSLLSSLRVARVPGAPPQHSPYAFWESEGLQGNIPEPVFHNANAAESSSRAAQAACSRLNKSQTKVVVDVLDQLGARSCSKGSHVKLVQGPPGTGKTQMLANLLESCCNRRHRALICAPSNTAVKEVVERLMKERLALVKTACAQQQFSSASHHGALQGEESESEAQCAASVRTTAGSSLSAGCRGRSDRESMLECLQPGNWLDDACISWYFRLLSEEAGDQILLVEASVAQVLRVSCDWVDLTELAIAHQLMERRLIIFPVSDAEGGGERFSGSHWSLLVARRVVGGWSFEHYDSLPLQPNRLHACLLAAKINALLEDDLRQLDEDFTDLCIMEVPRQTNSFDCGIFILAFCERLVEAFPYPPLDSALGAHVDAAQWREMLRGRLSEFSLQRDAHRLPRHAEAHLWLPRGPTLRSPITASYHNIAKRDVASFGLDNGSLADIVLIANQRTAKLEWNSARSAVYLDHRKKRIKRVAKFWLGRGHDDSKPFLEQPPWAEAGENPLAVLLYDSQKAWAIWHKRSRTSEGVPMSDYASAWQDPEGQRIADQSMDDFLAFAFRSLFLVLERHLAQLHADLPADDIRPVMPEVLLYDSEKAWGEYMQVYRDILWLRKKLSVLHESLHDLLSQAPRPATAGPQTPAGPCGPAPQPCESSGQRRGNCQERCELAFRAVLSASRGLVSELVDYLGLERGGDSGFEVESAKLHQAKQQLRLLVHPDKVPLEQRASATEAFKLIEAAWSHIEASCGASVAGIAQQQDGCTPSITARGLSAPSRAFFGKVNSESFVTLQDAVAQLQGACFVVKMAKSQILRRALLWHCTLIFCTANVAGRKMIQEQALPTVILDEACQCVEASTLIPLHVGAENLILIGDPAQLPATVISRFAKRLGYGRSTFDRLRNIGHSPELLDVQYRMHPDILAWPNKEFYAGLVKTSARVLCRSSSQWLDESLASAHMQHFLGTMRLFDTSSQKWLEEKRGSSWCNPNEALFILSALQCLVGSFQPADTIEIGIITPYKAQEQLIAEMLAEERYAWLQKHARVSTVDGFQGQECHVIAVSTVRTGDSIGFVSDEQRLNVAITRAMLKCWIVGDLAALESASYVWRELGEYARECGWIVDARMARAAAGADGDGDDDILFPGCGHAKAGPRSGGQSESSPEASLGGEGAVWEATSQLPVYQHCSFDSSHTGYLQVGWRCIQTGPSACVHGQAMLPIVTLAAITGWVVGGGAGVESRLTLLVQGCPTIQDESAQKTDVLMDPFTVFFTHDSISAKFRNGKLLDDTIRAMLDGLVDARGFPPLDVTKYPEDGKFYSLSNRRLFTFRVAANHGILDHVHTKVHDFESEFVQKVSRARGQSGVSKSKWERSYSTITGGMTVAVASCYAADQWPKQYRPKPAVGEALPAWPSVGPSATAPASPCASQPLTGPRAEEVTQTVMLHDSVGNEPEEVCELRICYESAQWDYRSRPHELQAALREFAEEHCLDSASFNASRATVRAQGSPSAMLAARAVLKDILEAHIDSDTRPQEDFRPIAMAYS